MAWSRLPDGKRLFTGDDGFDAEVAIIGGPWTLLSRLDPATRSTLRELVVDKSMIFRDDGIFLLEPPEPPDTLETLEWRAKAMSKRLAITTKVAAAELEDRFWYDPDEGVRRACFETLLWQMGDNVYSPEFSMAFLGDLTTHGQARLAEMVETLRRSPGDQAAPILVRLLDNPSFPRSLDFPALTLLVCCDTKGRWMRFLPLAPLPTDLLAAVSARLGKDKSELGSRVAEALLLQVPDTIGPKLQLELVRHVARAWNSTPEQVVRRSSLLRHFLKSRDSDVFTCCIDELLPDATSEPGAVGDDVRSLPADTLQRLSDEPQTYLPRLARGLAVGLTLLDDACLQTDTPTSPERAGRLYETLATHFGEGLRDAMQKRLAAIADDHERRLIEVLGRYAGPEALSWLNPLTSGLFRSSAVKRLAREAVAKIRERHGIAEDESRTRDLRGGLTVVPAADLDGALSMAGDQRPGPTNGTSKPSRKKR